MSATAELTHPATMALDRRAELIEELAPHGVSFGYQSTGGEWIETSPATLERVAPAFATKSSMMTAARNAGNAVPTARMFSQCSAWPTMSMEASQSARM